MQRKDADRFSMENLITDRIIGAAIEVHTILGGPGLLESISTTCIFSHENLKPNISLIPIQDIKMPTVRLF